MMGGLQLLFVMFPMAFANMSVPPLWSALFFLMILLLGFGQQLVFVESISLAIADNWPRLFGKKRLHLTLALCLALFLQGVTLCTGAGIWVMGLLDIFPCGAVQMYWLLIFQTIAIAWVLGGGRWVQKERKSFPLQRLWNSVRD